MSEFARNLTSKFSSFRYLGLESSPHVFPEERDFENPQNVAQIDKVKTVVLCETSKSPAKLESILQRAPMGAENIGARVGDENSDLTMAEKDCVLTSSDEDVEDLSAFMTERPQCLSERSVENFIGDENVIVEEILSGSFGAGVDGGDNDKIRSVCPNVAPGDDVEANDRRFSPGEVSAS